MKSISRYCGAFYTNLICEETYNLFKSSNSNTRKMSVLLGAFRLMQAKKIAKGRETKWQTE